MKTDTNKMIDLRYLETTFEGNKAIINKILKSFMDSASDLMQELTEHIENSDWENTKMIAHKIKSSYNAIGAKLVGNLLEQIELEASEENKMKIQLLNKQVKEMSLLVIKEIEEELMK